VSGDTDDGCDPVRMVQRVTHRQIGAPGMAKHHPVVDTLGPSYRFEIVDRLSEVVRPTLRAPDAPWARDTTLVPGRRDPTGVAGERFADPVRTTSTTINVRRSCYPSGSEQNDRGFQSK
jgi:hypothetical protein